MADRPIIFSGPMVRALLDGRKTQDRLVLCQFDPERDPPHAGPYIAGHKAATWTDREGTPWRYPGAKGAATGDRLYVREAFMPAPMEVAPAEPRPTLWNIAYGAGGQAEIMAPANYNPMLYNYERWNSSTHMPRWASRLTLTVTDVRVQRLQEISEADAIDEGCRPFFDESDPQVMKGPNGTEHRMLPMKGPVDAFRNLWNSLHGTEAWDANPWVVALTFTVAQGNIDAARKVMEGL